MRGPPPPLLLHVFPSFAVGGAQVRMAAIANRFGARWRHAVVALDGRHDCAERLAPHVPYEGVPFPYRRDEALPTRLSSIAVLLRSLAPAALVTSNWGSIEWAMANRLGPRLRHVHLEDGFGPDEAQGQKRRRVWTRRAVLRRSEVVLPSTVLLRAAREAWRLPERRLHFVPNGLDLRRFRPDGPRLDLAPEGEGPVIGTVAALRAEKNIARLLRAAAVLHAEGARFRLVVLGDGPERAGLERLAAELGLPARFPGHVADPAAAYRGFDVFALSSDTEQMPFSVLEAMASGLPVASTDVGDVRHMLGEGSAQHLAAKEDAALAAAIRPLLGDAALRARLGSANRAKAERDYDQEAMFAAHARLLDGALVTQE
jgi:glycosyltransferase involved in cell wall biosynthesis